MANNIFANQANGVIARQTIAADNMFDVGDIVIAYEIGASFLSWVPGRLINSFDTFQQDKSYYIIGGNTSLDRELYFAPRVAVLPAGSFRFATAGDIVANPQMKVGDYIIDEANVPDGGITDFPPQMAAGSTIYIKGGTYAYLFLDATNTNGVPGNPVKITNYSGKVVAPIGLIGKHLKLTGRYVPGATGDPNFRGWDTIGTGCLSGSFGFKATLPAGWDDFLSHNISLAGISTGIEIEYVESGDGGYAGVMIKQESGSADMNGIHLHDMYIHDVDGEGIYLGSTDADPQHQFNDLKIHDNLICRTGLNGIQIGQLRDNCFIYNNTIIAPSLSWARSFETYQDQATQFFLRKSGAQILNNLVIGGGENWMNFFIRPKGSIPQDNTVTLIQNNAFLYSRNTYSLYMSMNQVTASHIKINNNIFGKHFLSYTELYPNAFPTDFEVLIETYNSNGITVNFTNNIMDSTNPKGALFIAKTGDATVETDVTSTESGNLVVPSLNVPQFVNFMDFPSNFNYASLEYWVGVIPLTFPDSGGTLRNYKLDAYVMYRGKLYRSLHNNNADNLPQQATNQHWQLITFSNGTTTCIPDDGRLTSTDFYGLRSIGMSRNLSVPPTSTTTSTSSTSTTSTSSTSTTSTSTTSTTSTSTSTTTTTTAPPYTSNDLAASGSDNGDNTFTLKWTVNAADFTNKVFKLVGLGSSTLTGLGATAPDNLPSYLQAWLTGIFTGSVFLNLAIGGRYTLFALPEGTNTLVDVNKNIDAALVTKPDAAFISYPSNDIYFGLTPAEFVNNLQILFNAFRANGIPCFIETTQPRDDLSAIQQTALKTSANLIRTIFPAQFVVDTFDLLRDGTALTDAKINPIYSAGDGIHLNSGGQYVVFTQIVNKIQAFFSNPTFTLYEVERSTSPTSGFTLFDSISTGSTISKTYNRVSGVDFYYRIRARKPNATFTNYSNVVRIGQPIAVGTADQTIQINFAGASNPLPPADWNNFFATEGPGDTPVGIAITNLKNTSQIPTTVGATVTKKFGNSIPGNGEVNGIYPYNVMNSAWSVRDAFLDYSRLTFTGMSPNNVYKLDVFTAYGSFDVTGLGVRDTKNLSNRNFGIGSTAPVGHDANTTKLITLKGLIPASDGTLQIDFLPLISNVGAVSALTLTRYTNTNSPTTTTTSSTTSTSSTSTSSTTSTSTTSTTSTSSTSTSSTTSTTTTFTGPVIGRQKIDQYKISSGGTLTYGLTWLPTDYTSTNNQHPLIIFLHGAGETGTGTGGLNGLINTALPQLIAQGSNIEAVNPANGQLYKFIVCSPQAPNWSYSFPQLQYIIPDIIARYRVNPNMVYVTGLSAGGEGTWSSVTNNDVFTEKIAAIAPIGSTDLSSAAQEAKLHDITKIHNVKVWSICGSADAWLTTAYRYQGLVNSDNPTPKMVVTEIPGAGHTSATWNTAYSLGWRTNTFNLNLYEWFLQSARGPAVTTTTTSTSSTSTTSTSSTSTTSTSSTSTTSTSTTSTTSTSTTSTTTAYQQRILIDLGGDGVADNGNPDAGVKTPNNSVGAKGQAADGKWWNNVVDCRAGTWITTPVDTNNNNVTLSIAANVDPRQSFGDDYSINFAGVVQAVSDYPDTAVRDNCYFYDSTETCNLTFVIPGGKTASVKFWGNRDASGPRILKIKKSTDGSYTQEFDAAFNTTYATGVTFTGLTGTVIFNCQVKTGSAFGHVSVIDIQLT